MAQHDDPNHPDAIERPQSYDWKHLPGEKGFCARLVLPFFSTKYKTDMTQHCLLKALHDSVAPPDDETALQLHTESSALLHGSDIPDNALWRAPDIVSRFSPSTFFSVYHAHFHRAAPLLFHRLRAKAYEIPETSYQQQFTRQLRPVDGLGFSGSLFFYSHDRTLIIKSVGRRFEYTFLYEEMLDALAIYLLEHPRSLLSQITDVLYTFDMRLGGWLGISPGHYLVMVNVLKGLDKGAGGRKWDLKPQNFFEPTRDLVPDAVKSEAAKTGLAEELDEPIVLTPEDRRAFLKLIERDTEFLEYMGTIDYSLLLGRWPADQLPEIKEGNKDSNWFKGVRSGDGKWVYRATLLDFLWNFDQLRPRIMRTAGKLLPEQTVTTVPKRYRTEFLKMMDRYVVVPGEEERFYENDDDDDDEDNDAYNYGGDDDE